MSIKHLAIGCALLGLGLTSAPASAAVIFNYTNAYAYAYSYSSWDGNAQASSSGSDSQSAFSVPGAPLDEFAPSYAFSYNRTFTQTALGTATEETIATFNNAASGAVTFTGATTATVTSNPSGYAGAYNNGSQFDYQFSVNQTSNFSLSFATAATNGSPYGYYVELYGYSPDNSIYYGTPIAYYTGENTSGANNVSILPGNYYFYIYEYYYNDYITQSGPGSASASTAGDFNFAITTAVPEPATWAMMLLGFVGLGLAALRRTKKNGAALAAA
jgi:hypothetical protein